MGHLKTGLRAGATLGLSLIVAACGEGDGSSPPPAANQAPHFTSATASSVTENVTDAYQAAATDPEGSALTFSIAGGADAARFTISSTGALRFVSVPNFEAPQDADQNNVYDVQLGVTDGRATAALTVQITVTNSREGVSVRRVAAGFDQPLSVVPLPGSTDVLVAEKNGAILRLDPATGAKSLLFTVPNISTDGERGLLGLTTAPDYVTSGFLYVYVTNTDGDIEIRSYRRFGSGFAQFATLITIPHRQFNNHNGGWLAFGPDGNLYIGTGDGGGSGDPLNNAQNTRSLLGKILRVAINPDPYAGASPQFTSIPPDNPFADGIGGAREVFAYGLRNPFRASFSGNNLLIGDVGQDQIEEIDLLRPQDAGANFGWPFKEGSNVLRSGGPTGLIDPVLQYTHGAGPKQGQSVTGGYVYRGPVTALAGSYVFADFVSKNIWTITAASLVQGQTQSSGAFERRNEDFAPTTGTIDQIASFGEDATGNLYIVDLDGEIFQVITG